MHLPTFWGRAEFSVAETAEIIGVSEVTLRTWFVRNPYTEFEGRKEAHRLFFSPQQIFYYALVHQFASYGVPIRTAMGAAQGYARGDFPVDKWLIVTTADGKSTFELAEEIPFLSRPALILPLRALAVGLVGRASAFAETEGR